ncbi:hypothetical protein O9929_13735 [Vibrio lentus]|nr:hypothetical protein [Vibrio lentus]
MSRKQNVERLSKYARTELSKQHATSQGLEAMCSAAKAACGLAGQKAIARAGLSSKNRIPYRF